MFTLYSNTMAGEMLVMVLLAIFAMTTALSSSTDAHCLSSDFSLAMRTGTGSEYVSLKTVNKGTDGTLLLAAGPPSGDPGTPG